MNDQGVALATAKTELAALIDANSALISSEQTARADADSAIASDVTSLTSTVSGIQTDLNGVETEVDATSTAVTNLTSRVTNAEGDIASVASDVTSLTSTVSGIQTDLNGVETEVDATSTAVTNLTSRVTNTEGDIASVASDVTSLTTTVGTNTASITSASSSIDGIEAKYGVEIDNNGSISGFQLLSGAGSPSAFNVRADQFNLFNSSGVSGGTPFSVFTSSRTIDGVTYPAGTYMDNIYVQNSINVTDQLGNIIFGAGTPLSNTFIADAAINNAKISNGAINEAKIDNAAITEAKIANAAITTAKIDDLSVSTLKIADNAVSIMRSSVGGSGDKTIAIVNNTGVDVDLLVMAVVQASDSGQSPDGANPVTIEAGVKLRKLTSSGQTTGTVIGSLYKTETFAATTRSIEINGTAVATTTVANGTTRWIKSDGYNATQNDLIIFQRQK